MPKPASPANVLDREFLEIRCQLLHLAAALDRVDRGNGSMDEDPRMKQIHEALDVLENADGSRAKQIQLVFSLPYDQHWRSRFGLDK
jgi:hypothetical protein